MLERDEFSTKRYDIFKKIVYQLVECVQLFVETKKKIKRIVNHWNIPKKFLGSYLV